MIAHIADGMVLGGTLILAASLATTWRLIGQLTRGALRRYWQAMVTLILVFIVGYLLYAYTFTGRHVARTDLIVPGIFLLGAVFVWLSSMLSLRTALAVSEVNRLERENIADPLTGTFNRRYLDQRLGDEFRRAKRYGVSLCLLMIDLDKFKLINDQRGHDAGDRVLKRVARLIKSQLRDTDFLARYGGEEFIVGAPETQQPGAIGLAERIRAHVEATPVTLSGKREDPSEIRVTCSIGVAVYDKSMSGVEDLLRRADEYLLEAKRDGRNRVKAGAPPAADPATAGPTTPPR